VRQGEEADGLTAGQVVKLGAAGVHLTERARKVGAKTVELDGFGEKNKGGEASTSAVVGNEREQELQQYKPQHILDDLPAFAKGPLLWLIMRVFCLLPKPSPNGSPTNYITSAQLDDIASSQALPYTQYEIVSSTSTTRTP